MAPIDWDCDGNGSETDVQADIDWRSSAPDTSIGILESYNDWTNLVYKGGLIGKTSASGMEQARLSLAQETSMQELTEEMDQDIQREIDRASIE